MPMTSVSASAHEDRCSAFQLIGLNYSTGRRGGRGAKILCHITLKPITRHFSRLVTTNLFRINMYRVTILTSSLFK